MPHARRTLVAWLAISTTGFASGLSCSKPPDQGGPAQPSSPSANARITAVYIDSIDWRSGGRALLLRADGSGILRVTGKLENNAQYEKRYELPANAARFVTIEEVLVRQNASAIRLDQAMAPGDETATVRIWRGGREEAVLAGPPARNPAFRRLVDELRPHVEAIDISTTKPIYEGQADRSWAPPAH